MFPAPTLRVRGVGRYHSAARLQHDVNCAAVNQEVLVLRTDVNLAKWGHGEVELDCLSRSGWLETVRMKVEPFLSILSAGGVWTIHARVHDIDLASRYVLEELMRQAAERATKQVVETADVPTLPEALAYS